VKVMLLVLLNSYTDEIKRVKVRSFQ